MDGMPGGMGGAQTARERPSWDKHHATTASPSNIGRHVYFRSTFSRSLDFVAGSPVSPREERFRQAESSDPTYIALRKIRTPSEKLREAPFGVPGTYIGSER